jgi:hypothetical protein
LLPESCDSRGEYVSQSMKRSLHIAACIILALYCGISLPGLAQTSSAPAAQPATKPATQKETHMKASGPFDVKMAPQDDKTGDGLTRMLIDKQYHGDLEGTGKGQMLTAGISANNSGAYVAMEKFTGTLQGRSGTFALHHTGIMTGGKPDLTILVAPDSGTGQLAGISGKMIIIIAADGKHSYEFEYTIPNTN